MKEQRFRKMEIWKKAMDFIEVIYKMTNKFPKTEMYGLISQMRRAATSIALNIAEGSGADSDNEFNRFLTMALRSAYEVMCGTEVSQRLAYCNEQDRENVLKNCDELAAMIFGFKKKLKADSRMLKAE